jgi:predicted TIM-barrel fold metal-dependent hydrolase
MIIDTHVHYTQPNMPDRPYVHPAGPVEPMSVEELATEARAAGVDRVVQVTTVPMGNDNRYSFEGLAERPDVVAGVVARFDAFQPGLRDRLQTLGGTPGLLGVRFTLHHAWSDSWLRERSLDAFFALAQEMGITVYLYAPDQIGYLAETVRRYPGLRFVMDHSCLARGKDRPVEEIYRFWDKIIALARQPNVWIKASYFPESTSHAEAYPFSLAQARFRALYDRVGAERLIWGSNFPPVRRACTYSQTVEFMRDHCDFLGDDDRRAILGGNFMRHFLGARNLAA